MAQLRFAVLNDAKQLHAIYSYYVDNTVISFELEPPPLSEFTDRVREISKRFPFIVAEDGDQILGYACATIFKARAAYFPAAETTIYLRHDVLKR